MQTEEKYMRKKSSLYMIGIIVILLLIALVPSSIITPEAKKKYVNNDTDNSFSFKLLSTANAEGTFGKDIVIPIPDDDKTGRKPNINNFTQNTYEDSSIKVRIEQGRYLNANYTIAYIDITDASQLRTALAGKPGADRTIRMSDLAPKLNAIVAMNGDFFSQSKDGFIVRQGETLRKQTSSVHDLLLIDKKGDFHMIKRGGKEQIEKIKEITDKYKIINSFAFGPILVNNGVLQSVPEKYPHAPNYKNPRAAIAQIDKLKYAIIIVEGRTDNSEGLTIQELADLCSSLKLKNAFNLDGGNSAILYFNNGLFTKRSKENERYISDIIYFSSAVVE